MPEEEFVSWEDKLLDKLEEQFPEDDITIIYIYIGPKKRKQSLLVNREKIGFSWSPPLDRDTTEDGFNKIYDVCAGEINNAKKK
tara:strand:+ start:281 stop:532 length:252 start_codon:yes stop_codon:yes gene_type:complete